MSRMCHPVQLGGDSQRTLRQSTAPAPARDSSNWQTGSVAAHVAVGDDELVHGRGEDDVEIVPNEKDWESME